SLFDEEVEREFQRCAADLARNAKENKLTGMSLGRLLREPALQAFVFPCHERRNFAARASEAWKFFDLEDHEWRGRQCEVLSQQETLEDMQAELLEELGDMRWDRGSGILYDERAEAFSLGEPAVLQGTIDYDFGWSLRADKQAGVGALDNCQFKGSATASTHAGLSFFGADLSLFSLAGTARAEASSSGSLDVSYADIDTLSTRYFDPTSREFNAEKSAKLGTRPSYAAMLADPPWLLGGPEYSYWITLGPLPMKITFGAAVKAGLDYLVEANGANHCPGQSASELELVSEAKPWVRADAFADAEFDAGIASAGIRLALTLLQLSLPTGVSVLGGEHAYRFQNGGTLGTNLLSGSMSVFAEVGVDPLAVSFETELFGWPGLRSNTPFFRLDRTLSEDDLRLATAGAINLDAVSCKCASGEAGFCCGIECIKIDACLDPVSIEGTSYECAYRTSCGGYQSP
ncbi:MAG TPA: hypothetical protein VG963_26135, partial [Polyangiaceae bacterium]|nr:hypothetical protein [Polyangiaceae bacterium]